MVQISYADTDPIYTIENYPNFFRVVPSENALSLARIPFIRHFNWTGVGTIYQNLPRYSLVGIMLTSQQQPADHPSPIKEWAFPLVAALAHTNSQSPVLEQESDCV